MRAELAESDQQKAGRLIGAMLREWRWSDAGLKRRRKGDKHKARLIMRVRGRAEAT